VHDKRTAITINQHSENFKLNSGTQIIPETISSTVKLFFTYAGIDNRWNYYLYYNE